MIPEEAVQAAHSAICEENLEDCLDWRGKCVKAVEAAAPHFRKASTEWAAGFPGSVYPYNYYLTREEAQKFVDGMHEVGAVDMVVMTRDVLPFEAGEWKPV